MLIVRTPLRISFFGGGTDHPLWFRQHGGAVLSTTINKYIYLNMRRLPSIFDFNYRIVWRIIEEVKEVGEIKHPVVREVMRNYFANIPKRFEISYNADLPSQSGLASSSAFTVALLQGLCADAGKLISNNELAREAINVEQNLLKETVGCQDQIATAYGGLNHIRFTKDGEFHVSPVPVSMERRSELEQHLMLFFTKFQRSANEIEIAKLKNYDSKQASLHRMAGMADEGQGLILSNREPMDRFGALLDEAWQLKRDLSTSVSSSDIDGAYKAAMEAGASGGKLLGAGGGGFLLFIVKPAWRKKVRQALSSLVEVPVKLESRGSHLALYDPTLDNFDNGLPVHEAAKSRVGVA